MITSGLSVPLSNYDDCGYFLSVFISLVKRVNQLRELLKSCRSGLSMPHTNTTGHVVKTAHRNALIAQGHEVETEVGFLKWGLWKLTGRADIIDATTGEIWEIKPAQKTFDNNPAWFYVRAEDQLASYLWGTVQNTTRHVLLMTVEFKVGGAIPSCTIPYKNGKFIEYWCEGDGIIWYQEIDDNDDRRKQRHTETAWLYAVAEGAIAGAVLVKITAGVLDAKCFSDVFR